MPYTPQYITADQFYDLFGIDLSLELKNNDNTGNKVNSFLFRVESVVLGFMQVDMYKKIDFNDLSAYQLGLMRLAMLEQAQYMLRNGDVTTDSGYDPTNGVVVNREVLKGLTLAPMTIRHLTMAGLFSRKIQHGFGWFDDFYGY